MRLHSGLSYTVNVETTLPHNGKTGGFVPARFAITMIPISAMIEKLCNQCRGDTV